jgi:hypothetical protein
MYPNFQIMEMTGISTLWFSGSLCHKTTQQVINYVTNNAIYETIMLKRK